MRASKVLSAVIVVACAVAAASSAGAAPCDEAEATARTAEIRGLLERESRRTRRWNLGWGIGFGVLAVGQLGLTAADYTPIGDYDEDKEHGLYVAATKAAIASLAHVVLPLKMAWPGPATGDPCVDRDAAERALQRSGDNEKRSFYLNHLGAIAMNVGGLLVLGLGFDTWKEGWLSVALGYPVGLLHAYTQPRRVWHVARRVPPDVAITVLRNEHTWGLAIGGAF